ncbi:MAG: GxxExxY protein [Muribaculaceae bacterium]|nr:GxxExxY protein [Muribaculaceae bacterium]
MENNDIERLMAQIISSSYDVINSLGTGFLESVYQRALIMELRSKGISCEMEKPIEVFYKGEIVGAYRADIVVEDKIIIETKVCDEIALAHEFQVVNYLKASKIDYGIIINFGTLPLGIKRKFRTKKAV